jgi:hypothetical protein
VWESGNGLFFPNGPRGMNSTRKEEMKQTEGLTKLLVVEVTAPNDDRAYLFNREMNHLKQPFRPSHKQTIIYLLKCLVCS